MIDINKNNWKKYAGALMQQDEAEMAFAKAASSIISSKAAPIFKDPYFLGFEIVQTNDSHTKMIGIFVFRIEKKLFYVPVAYIDGSLKLTDLLYNADEKLFTMLSPEWCEYYISKLESKVAELIPTNGQTSQNRGTQDMRLRWLAYPPYMAKGASVLERKPGYKPESPLVIFDFIKEAKDIFSEEDFKTALANISAREKLAGEDNKKRLLHDYIVAGGYEVFNKLANWIENDYEFANNVVTFLDQDDFMPREMLEAEANKSAMQKRAAEELEKSKFQKLDPHSDIKDDIVVYMGKFNPFTNKTASEQIQTGYSIEDRRDSGKLDPIIVDESERFGGGPSAIGYGVYNLLTSGNDIVKVFMVTGDSDYGKRPGLIISLEEDADKQGMHSYYNTNSSEDRYMSMSTPILAPGIHGQHVPWSRLMCSEILDATSDDIKKIVKDLPEENKVYGIFDADASYLSDEAFYIKSVKGSEEDGYEIIAVPLRGYSYVSSNVITDPDSELTLRINPDALRIMTDLKIFTKNTKWLEIPIINFIEEDEIKNTPVGEDNKPLISDKTKFKAKNNQIKIKLADWVPGTLSNYINTVNKAGYSSATLKSMSKLGKYRLDFVDNKDTKYRSKLASKLKLMASFNISEQDADYIIKEADENEGKPFKFMYKSAGRIILNPDPEFWEGFDSDLGVRYQVPEVIPVMTSAVSINAPAPRYGDVIPSLTPDVKSDIVSQAEPTSVKEDETGDVFLRTASPNMLATLAKVTGQTSLFEHGIIGSLSKTHDASLFIGEFLPDMLQGEDKLGRLLFLVNLSPASFISLYGNDDIKSLENNILTLFKQQGELILQLLQKNKEQQPNITTVEINQE